MIQLVNDICSFQVGHCKRDRGHPVMETVDLLEVAKECVERQKLNARRAYISLTYLGESAPVLGSRALLDELCQNLCDNAIRYNRPGGKVQIITTCNRDGHCSLTVADNGIGIPREAQASVFERFYRVDKSRSKATGAPGLGLPSSSTLPASTTPASNWKVRWTLAPPLPSPFLLPLNTA